MTTAPIYLLPALLPMMAIAIFTSSLVLAGMARLRHLFGASWLSVKFDDYPLSVVGLLTIGVAMVFMLLKAIFWG